MSPAELAFRSRQRVYILAERLTPNDPERPNRRPCSFDTRRCSTRLQSLVGQLEYDNNELARNEIRDLLYQAISSRFFCSVEDTNSTNRLINTLADSHAGLSQETISRADSICGGEFAILGYGQISFGDPVNWHLDPIAMCESPLIHWSRINPLSRNQVGDSKVVWELNRHQWILDLGQAYRLTGDQRYADRFAHLVTDWIDANPPGHGINWCSALEASMRLISWCWGLFLFRGSSALSAELFLKILASIQCHAQFIERNYSRYYSPNTHLTVEALGLFYVGTLLPELEGAERWQSMGSRTLIEQISTQVYSDGGYFEQSTRYQYYTVEIYLHFVVLAQRNSHVLPRYVERTLENMVHFLMHLRRPDGTLPQIGDTDGGWLLPFVHRKTGDYRGLFSTAAILFGNSSFAWAAKGVAPEALWLLGDESFWDAPAPVAHRPVSKPLTNFSESGYVVMRNGWGDDAHQLIIDTGPLGCPVSSGHGHADLLSIQCSGWGENFLVDAGTFCYTADEKWRDYFRGTSAHNTLVVDGQCQASPRSAFSWDSRPKASLTQCSALPGYSVVDGNHSAYGTDESPIIHRRRILFIAGSYWLVVDDVIGTGEHTVDLHYQFAPMAVTQNDTGWIHAKGNNSSLLLKVIGNTNLTTSIVSGSEEPRLGWYSPNYGQRVPAPSLTASTKTELPLRLVTVIHPWNHAKRHDQQTSVEEASRRAKALLGA